MPSALPSRRMAGPPMVRLSLPLTAMMESRMASDSRRRKGILHSSRLPGSVLMAIRARRL